LQQTQLCQKGIAMEKIFDRLLIEFLIPAFLMFISLVLAADAILGKRFDLSNPQHRSALLGNGVLLVGGILFILHPQHVPEFALQPDLSHLALGERTRVFDVPQARHIQGAVLAEDAHMVARLPGSSKEIRTSDQSGEQKGR
jgi:hypothetical protein